MVRKRKREQEIWGELRSIGMVRKRKEAGKLGRTEKYRNGKKKKGAGEWGEWRSIGMVRKEREQEGW